MTDDNQRAVLQEKFKIATARATEFDEAARRSREGLIELNAKAGGARGKKRAYERPKAAPQSGIFKRYE